MFPATRLAQFPGILPWARYGSLAPLRFAIVVAGAAILAASLGPTARAQPLTFRSHEFAQDLTVGYAVVAVDINDDARPDVVVVDSERVLWYDNPGWHVHTLIQGLTKKDNVCIAPHDIDGDGRLDFALGADWRPFDTETGGTIQWLGRDSIGDNSWTVRMIGEEPTVHRMRWVNVDDDDAMELVVVPLMGRGTTKPDYAERPVRVLAFDVPADPRRDRWPMRVLNEELHVTHNFFPTDLDSDGRTDLLITAFEGVFLLSRDADGRWTSSQLGAGNQETSPNRGASEIKSGTLLVDGQPKPYIATIEPWHGFQVVVYLPPADHGPGLWQRLVLDEELQWGHAVWCANLDADADEELVIGVRDDKDAQHQRGLRIYDPSDRGRKWNRTLVEPGAVAIEDLAVADFDGDGDADIVAVGRQTHNARIYFNETAGAATRR